MKKYPTTLNNMIIKCFQDDIKGDIKGVNLFLSIFIAITALLMFTVKDEMKKYPTTLNNMIIRGKVNDPELE